MAFEATEETTVELNHYPYWVHFVGGSKDDTDEPYWNDETRMDYLSMRLMATGTVLPGKKSVPM